jgi:hypothetical protein
MPRAVQRSRELARILSLPTREWETQAAALVEPLSAMLRIPGGQQTLFPAQAAALAEFHDHGGAFFQGRVSVGKTLVSVLAPRVTEFTGFPAQRPMLVIPANLREKTLRDIRRASKHWCVRPIRINSYSELGVVSGLEIFRTYQPDLLILDEAHSAMNIHDARCAKQINRYVEWCRTNKVPLRVIAMSGTFMNTSIKDFAHILRWCVPQLMPLPIDKAELQDWADAVDDRIKEDMRLDPGALMVFADAKEAQTLDTLSAVRRGLRRRIFSTPGFLTTEGVGYEGPLTVTCHEVPPPPDVDDMIRTLRKDFMTPDGWTFADRATMWHHVRELTLGFYYVWDPRPPKPWIDARKAWHSVARAIIANNKREIDSEYQLELEIRHAIKRGQQHQAQREYTAWADIRHTFRPNSKAVWVSDHAIKWCAEWARNNKGVIWVQHTAFARRLSEVTGIRYYVKNGYCGRHYIEDASPDECVIASVAANKEGRNLQTIWSRALTVSAGTLGKLWEQKLGRIHRDGQKAPEVRWDVYIGCLEMHRGLAMAHQNAFSMQELLGTPQKLCYAKLILPEVQHTHLAAFRAEVD